MPVKLLNQKASLNKSADDFGIPEATLRRYATKQLTDYSSKLGWFRPVLNAELEDKLATYLVELGRRYFSMASLQFRKFAYEYAVKIDSSTALKMKLSQQG